MADLNYADKVTQLVKDAEARGLAIVPVFSFDFYELVEIARDILLLREDKIVDFVNDKYHEFASMITALREGDVVLCNGGLEVKYVTRDGVKVWEIRKAEEDGG